MSIEPGTYRHFKGNEYEVLGVARHSETLEELVVYQGKYQSAEFGDNPIWVRPCALFTDTVEKDGQTIPRFEKI